MDTEVMDDLGQDAAAVAAVRAGDAERYRELVERHERQVYAVAWSRLGDAELAEEAAQEAFIKGYRRLWLLGDGAKFAGWIAAIARNAAINLGMRHRRELQKRERWALEQPVAESGSVAETEHSHTPETLQASLLELPAAHRESLVLFYLEGKSGEEAALALGISESAFRVRLHRAKAALRERLEEKLAGSLEKLRPSKALVPAVMLSVLATSSAQAATTGGAVTAGIGTKVLTTLGKSSMFSWLLPFIVLIGLLPGMVFAWWWTRLERRNFRQQDGFRPRLYDHFRRSFLWGFPLLMVLAIGLSHLGEATWGLQTTLGIFAAFLIIPTCLGLRLLAINRSRFYVVTVIGACVTNAVFAMVGLGFLPLMAINLAVILSAFISLVSGQRPVRMDYSLFLRAVQKMLRSTETPTVDTPSTLRRDELLGYARFLGGQWLVNDFCWEAKGLRLFLPPVKSSFLSNMIRVFVPLRQQASSIYLKWDGSVSADCGSGDLSALHATEVDGLPSIADLEKQVEAAMEQAWRHFRAGHPAVAQQLLGEVMEEDVFLVPPARSKANRLQKWVLGNCLIVLAGLLLLLSLRPQWLSSYKPLRVTEAQVRHALDEISSGGLNGAALSNSLPYPIMIGFAPPAKGFFADASFAIVRHEVLRYAGVSLKSDVASRLSPLESAWLLHRSIDVGWVTLEDLELTPEQVSQHLRQKEPAWKFWLSRRAVTSGNEKLTVEGIDAAQLSQLRFLKQVNCLDLVEREKLIRKMASWQIVSDGPYADRPPMPNWRKVRGLFGTSGWPVLQDTYCVVAALEVLGGLDRIDREACIQGVLRLHRSAGFFGAGPTHEGWKLAVKGDARDTLCAFETLRILGALDRIDDLEEWQFRVRSEGNDEQVTWEQIEAWLCQQRLARIVSERKANPQAPVRSLLEP